MTLIAPISPYKHITDFCLLLCLTSFCSCPIIGLMKNFSLVSWTIDLLLSKHFRCKKLHLKTPRYSEVLAWSYLHFLGRRCYTSTLISLKKFGNISSVLKFMQLIPPPPPQCLLFYFFFLTRHIILANFYCDPHPNHDHSVL